MTSANKISANVNIMEFHIPRWQEIPDIGLYMEQSIQFIHSRLREYCEPFGIVPVTKNMINNYVKAKIVEAPVNRRYSRLALAMIIVVSLMKACYSTEEVNKLIKMGLKLEGVGLTYDRFCEAVENAIKSVFSGEVAAKDENINGRAKKYIMDNFALSMACKYYVYHEFIKKNEV